MKVIVEQGGYHPVFRIWDNDNREIACHRQDVVELIRKLQEGEEIPRENEKRELKTDSVVQAISILASMVQEVYWQHKAPHCGADMTEYCVDCQHYIMCQATSNLRRILDNLPKGEK